MSDFPVTATVKATAWYRAKHLGGTVFLGAVAVAGVIGTMTGPPSFISKEHWEMLTFAAIILSTVAKAIQSKSGATTAAVPKP